MTSACSWSLRAASAIVAALRVVSDVRGPRPLQAAYFDIFGSRKALGRESYRGELRPKLSLNHPIVAGRYHAGL